MYIDIDYKTSPLIGKHVCSKCGVDFKLSEGLMVGVSEKEGKSTIFLCGKCLENHQPCQTVEFVFGRERYPKVGSR